jgi:hypothetical protein
MGKASGIVNTARQVGALLVAAGAAALGAASAAAGRVRPAEAPIVAVSTSRA